MVKIPKISPNLLLITGLAVAAFFITREIRGAGQDLANFGKDFKPFENFPEIKVPEIKFPKFEFKNPFEKEKGIPSNPLKQTVTQQEEIFGRVITKSESDEINKISNQIAKGEKVTIAKPFVSLLKEFNPPNVFGFGILGENKKGISTTLAKSLGIFDKRVNEISASQIRQLENIDIKENTFDILKGSAGVNAQNFFSIFKIPFTTSKQQEKNTSIAKMIGQQEQKQITPTFENGKLNVTSNIGNFKGGGVGFIGGTVNETPIKFLSLGQIIDKFKVSASKARDIQFQSRNEGTGFDFGTNTGNALDLTPLIRTNLPSTNVSNPAFIGKSATEIAAILINGGSQGFA